MALAGGAALALTACQRPAATIVQQLPDPVLSSQPAQPQVQPDDEPDGSSAG